MRDDSFFRIKAQLQKKDEEIRNKLKEMRNKLKERRDKAITDGAELESPTDDSL